MKGAFEAAAEFMIGDSLHLLTLSMLGFNLPNMRKQVWYTARVYKCIESHRSYNINGHMSYYEVGDIIELLGENVDLYIHLTYPSKFEFITQYVGVY